MPVTTPTISQHTFEFSKGLIEVHNASIRFQVLAKDMGAEYKAKKMMNDWVRMLNRIQIDLKNVIGNVAYQKLLQDEILNDESSLQISQITDMILCLGKDKRDQIEGYVEEVYNNR